MKIKENEKGGGDGEEIKDGWREDSVVEHIPSFCEVLSLISSTVFSPSSSPQENHFMQSEHITVSTLRMDPVTVSTTGYSFCNKNQKRNFDLVETSQLLDLEITMYFEILV